MGIIWKIKMVLLSTLAALVIIVHSAEEDYDTSYRGDHELRPRILDTGTRRYEQQPWRTLKDEPIIHPSTPDPTIDETSDEPLRRRRPGRKRKRRPELYSVEDSSSEKFFNEPLRPNIELEDRESDPPKRRRKKQERNKWGDPDRPVRRRAQRRKRPTSDTWPVLSEFSEYRPNKNDDLIEIRTEAPDVVNVDGHYKQDADADLRIEPDKYSLPQSSYVRPQEDKYDKPFIEDYRQEEPIVYHPVVEDKDTVYKPVKDDHSLSEFSQEEFLTQDTRKTKEIVKQKMTEKSQTHLREFFKSQDKGAIDPLTLKDILKKSNGSSLSEILQQHNLSLTDLLHGKEVALSILKTEEPPIQPHSVTKVIDDEDKEKYVDEVTEDKDVDQDDNDSSEEMPKKITTNVETEYDQDTYIHYRDSDDTTAKEEITTPAIIERTTTTTTTTTTTQKPTAETTKRANIRRFPVDSRRKQRIRPVLNTNTYKSPLNRDLVALNARKYFNSHRRRNVTRTSEWRDVIPVAKKNITTQEVKEPVETTTINNVPEETTTQYVIQEIENVTVDITPEDNNAVPKENIEPQAIEIESAESNNFKTTTPNVIIAEKPIIRPTLNATGLRRQVYNNILKKKRRKLKYSSTEPPQDDLLKNLYGIPNLVSSSEFIARTQGPQTSLDDVTILEDVPATEVSVKEESKPKSTRHSTAPPIVDSITEESAKFEIEEILNDARVSAKLSRILMERNMTLRELVEHRERGSSHVHLADIFQNTSKEINSLEPFLSKSLIEPISKETYPLRALLEGKIHDTTTKASATDPEVDSEGYVNVPGKMDFGSNVNENAENMGIMSLFHNFTSNMTNNSMYTNDNVVKKDSEGSPYSTSITVVNPTDTNDSNETVREGRVVHELKENQDDIVSWNEIFSLMRRNYENRTKYSQEGAIPAETIKKPTLDEDLNSDGLIILEDLQHIDEFDHVVRSQENLDAHTNENIETPAKPSGILDRMPSHTRSVTLATASIVGLAMVLFLLTYIGYKWRKQRNISNKKNYADERIPTPVFESRKGHKNNSSSRSISPMLTSNIYTLSTVDSQNGKESPEYMWDSLRKPFQ